ncbi:YrrS family protein [Bacillus salipaludis]|uniref:YrrS family protein n=1 Tax=Bacillus salipaludis TaxID=2547811 RepID=A0ABW8RFZ5_9BACI
MNNDFNQNSRSGYRAKRKKTNIVLNSLIIIVLLLIIFVAYTIFASGGDDKAAPKKETPKTEQKETVHKEKKTKEDKEVTKDDSSSKDATEEEQESEEASTPEKTDDSQAVVSEDGTTIENPSWKPVGTTQTGEHTPVYSGVDWDEMLSAISYATGIENNNMTVIWLGRDQSKANASVGTVSAKDTKEKYKVFIEWVDGQGWKPTKVIKLTD